LEKLEFISGSISIRNVIKMSQKQSKRVCMRLMYLRTHFDPVILTTTNIENASFELENYYNFCQSPETVENKLKIPFLNLK
jgi:hypothetical protein